MRELIASASLQVVCLLGGQLNILYLYSKPGNLLSLIREVFKRRMLKEASKIFVVKASVVQRVAKSTIIYLKIASQIRIKFGSMFDLNLHLL